MRKYYIPDHVHFAIESDSAVFLDLRRDQYSLLVGQQARTFSDLISRAPDSNRRVVLLDGATHNSDSTALEDDLVSDLLQNGVLSPHISTSTELTSQLPQLPQDNLLACTEPYGAKITPGDLWTFLISCVIAEWRLSHASIENTVRAIRRRKLPHESNNKFDMKDARNLVSIYNRLRPLVPHDYLCLFDSLSLIEFLARHNCYPSWVFSIQLEPWGAHCWVQHETTVFNEDVDFARTFLPIMAV